MPIQDNRRFQHWMWIPECGTIFEESTRSRMKEFMSVVHEADPRCDFVINPRVYKYIFPPEMQYPVEKELIGIADILDYSAQLGCKVLVMATQTSKSVPWQSLLKERRSEYFSSIRLRTYNGIQYPDWNFDGDPRWDPSHHIVDYVNKTVRINYPKEGEHRSWDRRLFIKLRNVPQNKWGQISFKVQNVGEDLGFGITGYNYGVRFTPSDNHDRWIAWEGRTETYTRELEQGKWFVLQRFHTLDIQDFQVTIFYKINEELSNPDGHVEITDVKFGDSPFMDDEVDGGIVDRLKWCSLKASDADDVEDEGYWTQITNAKSGFTNPLHRPHIFNFQCQKMQEIQNSWGDHPAFGGLWCNEDEHRFGGWEKDYPEDKNVGELFGELAAERANFWATISDKPIYIFGDMFSLYHGEQEYYHQVNPRNGGHTRTMKGFKRLNRARNTVFVEWHARKELSFEYMRKINDYWKSTGERWILGTPLPDDYWDPESANHYEKMRLAIPLSSNCEGVMHMGWENFNYVMEPQKLQQIVDVIQHIKSIQCPQCVGRELVKILEGYASQEIELKDLRSKTILLNDPDFLAAYKAVMTVLPQ